MGVAGFAIVDFRVWRSGSRLVVASLTALRLGFGMGLALKALVLKVWDSASRK